MKRKKGRVVSCITFCLKKMIYFVSLHPREYYLANSGITQLSLISLKIIKKIS